MGRLPQPPGSSSSCLRASRISRASGGSKNITHRSWRVTKGPVAIWKNGNTRRTSGSPFVTGNLPFAGQRRSAGRACLQQRMTEDLDGADYDEGKQRPAHQRDGFCARHCAALVQRSHHQHAGAHHAALRQAVHLLHQAVNTAQTAHSREGTVEQYETTCARAGV
mmetsp:Transcript_7617/g.32179  ORF Transcript_7617/g.32179 Transcript_7617/m.32179 type:complete len:165 (+) Transcript_7617:87-581(+)